MRARADIPSFLQSSFLTRQAIQDKHRRREYAIFFGGTRRRGFDPRVYSPSLGYSNAGLDSLDSNHAARQAKRFPAGVHA